MTSADVTSGDVTSAAGISRSTPPSGTGCAECSAGAQPGWWLHLRRCAQCGHVGCCDSSPSQHASAHFASSQHPLMQSFEPGEDWFWDYRSSQYVDGAQLAAPTSHPNGQAVPGPAGKVPTGWRQELN